MDNKKFIKPDKPLHEWKVAIIHYWFVTWRGGEKVVESILKLFPNADVYTLFYDEEVCGPHLKGHHVYTSVLNTPTLRRHYQKTFPLYPEGIQSLKLKDEYDLVISSESGPAKGVKVPDHTPHLSYVHTPMRYCWGYRESYLESIPGFARGIADWFFERLRKWDLTTVDNVDCYLANSQNVADRITRYYNKSSSVVYPPIALDLFQKDRLITAPVKERNYYLSFGAVTPYKNIDLLVDTFNKNGQELMVIGDGSEKEKLSKVAGDNIQFTGSLPWKKITEYILGAKALLFPGEEDFGMIPLEVMAHGLPVIALGKGGALETVIENKELPAESSGLFFHENSVNALQEALEDFEKIADQMNPEWIFNHARTFGEDQFLENFLQKIEQCFTPED